MPLTSSSPCVWPDSTLTGRAWLGVALLVAVAGCGLEREASGSDSTRPVGELDASSPDTDPSSAAPSREDDGGAEVDADVTLADAGRGCELSGKFALRLQTQVRWAGTTLFDIVPIIPPGNGALDVYVMADLEKSSEGQRATLRACGATIPDFSSSVLETYGVAIPGEVWEKVTRTWTTTFRADCSEPGCAYVSDPVVAQLGLDLPTDRPWPSARDSIDVASLRDEDSDQVPGILLRARGPKDPGPVQYSHPPTSYLLSARASELFIALRLRAALDGVIDSCDRFHGSLPDTTLDTRALACRLELGLRCNDDQVGFVDDNLPVWKVDGAAMQGVRVAADASCTDVRNAAF